MNAPLLAQLITALRCLPGVGPKNAQRMAFYLLERNRKGALHLAQTLIAACERIGHCQLCRNFSETAICALCDHPERTQHQICIVETPADVIAIEQSSIYKGRYFVLMGHLSPLDGVGPQQLGLDQFAQQLQQCPIDEIIIATNPTVEGDATAQYIQDMASAYPRIRVTRLAQGIPLGGELEYMDRGTLSQAFSGRHEF